MNEFLAQLLPLFEISWIDALTVVLSAIAIYLVFLVFVRLFGARVLTQVSTFDALIVIMLGAVAGRVILLNVPVLPSGILGLATLFILEATLGELRGRGRGTKLLNQRPTAVVVNGEVQDARLRRVHLTRDELMSSLRLAGVRHLAEVQLAVFESHGRISVLRAGESIDTELVADVRGIERLRAEP